MTVYLTKAMYGRKGSSDSQFQRLGLSWRGRQQEHERPGHTVTAVRKQEAMNAWAHILLSRQAEPPDYGMIGPRFRVPLPFSGNLISMIPHRPVS